jgi:cytosol alanyl aminopeptidase
MRSALCAATVVAVCMAGAAMLCQAQTPASGDFTPPTLRLPAGPQPTRYAVSLTVIPGEAKASGEITIDVELDRPHAVIWLNADALTVAQASVDDAATKVGVLSGHEQVVGLTFDPPLASGKHRLTLAFAAEQSRNSTRGIFALQDGGSWYAMTQFEPLSARRAFPCFDEPGFKVPWQLTLRVPRELVAISNTPIVSDTNVADGLKEIRFAETRPLPSYLVAFAVGPWQPIDLGGVGMNPTPMRIVVPRGRTDEAGFVASAYPQIFARLERWFGLAYPYAKLDQVAIPLTVGFAMENVGMITYGAPTILAKPDAATPRFRRGAASVGAHEMAHQWFGNLVTTAWWNDIWLNEAFATWFAAKMVDQWRPDYEHGAARSVERADAIAADMLASARRIREPIEERGDILTAFDAITYQKGATVIGMFEGWIGEEPFRRGIRRYLDARRDSTATVEDFLGALDAESKRPVASAFSTFLDQNGVPRVDINLHCSARGASLDLTQTRLSPLGAAATPGSRWKIPVCVTYGQGAAKHEACTLLTDPSATLPLQGACPTLVFANTGGRGYYVASYGGKLLAHLAADRKALSSSEYASVLYDIRALVQSGAVSGGEALRWIRDAANSHDRYVVTAAIELTAFVRDTLVTDADRGQFVAFVDRTFGARARALGYAPRPGEDDDDQLVRRSMLRLVAPNDAALAAEARRLAVAWMARHDAIDPSMVDTVLIIAAETGDAATFDAMLAEAKSTKDSLDRRNLMVALLAFTDPALARRGLGVLLDPDFDVRESTTALWISSYAVPPRRATADFIAANFDALAQRVSSEVPGQWPYFARRLCSEQDRDNVDAFWRSRIASYPGAERTLNQAEEQIRLCAALRAAQAPAVAAFLAKH